MVAVGAIDIPVELPLVVLQQQVQLANQMIGSILPNAGLVTRGLADIFGANVFDNLLFQVGTTNKALSLTKDVIKNNDKYLKIIENISWGPRFLGETLGINKAVAQAAETVKANLLPAIEKVAPGAVPAAQKLKETYVQQIDKVTTRVNQFKTEMESTLGKTKMGNAILRDMDLIQKSLKETVSDSKALQLVLDTLNAPGKLAGEMQKFGVYFNDMMAYGDIQVRNMLNLTTQVLDSATSLTSGGGLNPLGGIVGPQLSKMFDVGTGIAEFVTFDKLATSFSALASNGGDTEEAIQGVIDETVRLGAGTSKTAQEVAETAIEFYKLGYTSESTTKSLEGIVKTSEATGEKLLTVGSILASTMNQFQLPAEKAGELADMLAAVSNKSATGISELGESLKYVGAVSKSANQTVEDTALVLGLLSNTGMKGSMAGTALANALLGLQRSAAAAKGSLGATREELKLTTEDMVALGSMTDGTGSAGGQTDLIKGGGLKAKALSALGLDRSSLLTATGDLKAITEIIPTLKTGVQNLKSTAEGAAMVPVVINAIFGQEGGRAVLSLLNTTEEQMQDLQSTIENSKGFSANTSEKMLEGLAGTLTKLSSAVSTVALNVGEFYSEGLLPLAEGALSVVNAFLALPKPILQFTLGLMGWAPLIIVVFKALRTWVLVQEGLKASTIAFTFVQKLSSVQLAISTAQTWLATKAETVRAAILAALGKEASGLTLKQVIMNALTLKGITITTLATAAQKGLAGAYMAAAQALSVNQSTNIKAIKLAGDIIKGTITWTASVVNNTTAINLFSAAQLKAIVVAKTRDAIDAASVGIRNVLTTLTQKQTYLDLAHNAAATAKNALTVAQTAVTGTLATITGVFSGKQAVANVQLSTAAIKTSLVTAAKSAYALAVGRATAANLGLIQSVALAAVRLVALAAAAWAVSQAWNSLTAGWKEANEISNTTKEIQKLAKENLNLKTSSEQAASVWDQFKATLLEKGPIEAIQGLIKSIPIISDALNAGLGLFGKELTTTSEQKSAVAMIAQAKQTEVINQLLGNGIKLVQDYGLATVDLADKQRLQGQSLQDLKDKFGGQIQTIDAVIEKLKSQKGASEEQDAIIKTNIKNLEKQKMLLRGKIGELENNTSVTTNNADAQKELAVSLDEVSAKYEKLNKAAELKATGQQLELQEQLVSGDIDPKEAAKQQIQIERQAIEERISINQQKMQELKVAQVGLTGEELKKVQDELGTLELQGLKDRIEAAKSKLLEKKEIEQQALDELAKKYEETNHKIKQAETDRNIAIKQQLLEGSISKEEAAEMEGDAKIQSIDAELKAEQSRLKEIRSLRGRGTISAEEAAKQEMQITEKVGQLKLQQIQAELQKQEEKNRKILEDMMRQEEIAKSQLQQQETTSIIQVKQQELAGLSPDKAAEKSEQIKLDSIRNEIKLEKDKAANVDKLLREGVIDAEEAEDRKRKIKEDSLNLDLKLVEQELAMQKAKNDKILKEEENRITKLQQLNQANSIKGNIELINQQLGGQISPDDVGTKQAEMAKEQAIEEQKLIQERINSVKKLASQKILSEEESKAKLEQLGIELLQSQEKLAQQELAIKEAKTQEILRKEEAAQKRLEQVTKEASARRTLELLQGQAAGILTVEQAQKRQAEIQKQGILDELNLLENQRKSTERLISEGVISEQEAVDKRAELTNREIELKSQLAQQEIQLREERNKKILENEEATLQKIEQANQLSLAQRNVELLKQQLAGSLNAQQVAEKQSQIQKQTVQDELNLIKKKQQSIAKQEEMGLITSKEAAQKRSELVLQELQTQEKVLQQELQLQEEKNRRILESAEQTSQKLKQQLEQRLAAETIAVKQAQLQGGLSAKEAANQLEEIQQGATERNINRLNEELQQVKDLRAKGLISAEEAADKEAGIQNELSGEIIKSLDAQIAAKEAAVQAFLQSIEMRVEQAKLSLEESGMGVDNTKDRLQGQLDLAGAQVNLATAQNTLEDQRLQFKLKQMEMAGNEVAAEQVRQQIYAAQFEALMDQQEAKKQELKLTQQMRDLDLERQKISAELAVLDAQAAIEKAKAEGKSAEEIQLLTRRLKLQQNAVDLIGEAVARSGQLNKLELETTQVNDVAAREKLQQDEQIRIMEAQKKIMEEQAQAAGDTLGGGEKTKAEQPAGMGGEMAGGAMETGTEQTQSQSTEDKFGASGGIGPERMMEIMLGRHLGGGSPLQQEQLQQIPSNMPVPPSMQAPMNIDTQAMQSGQGNVEGMISSLENKVIERLDALIAVNQQAINSPSNLTVISNDPVADSTKLLNDLTKLK